MEDILVELIAASPVALAIFYAWHREANLFREVIAGKDVDIAFWRNRGEGATRAAIVATDDDMSAVEIVKAMENVPADEIGGGD